MGNPGFVIGNIARGEDFWNRDEELEAIWRALQKTNVLLKAPRRFGKTSIMLRVHEKPRDAHKVFFQDTESMREPEEFLSRIIADLISDSTIRKVFSSTGKFFSDLSKRFETLEITAENLPEIRLRLRKDLGRDWAEKGDKLIGHLRKYEGRIIIILDELPMLIKNIERKKGKETSVDFLNWFRSIRQIPGLDHIRWLVGGSIGIEQVVEQTGAGIKTINDFEIVRVGPFSEGDGRAFISALLEKEGGIRDMPAATIDALLKTIGPPIPYFIQILLRECLYLMPSHDPASLSKTLIQKAYQEGVLGPANRTYFQHYYTRLKEYYDHDLEMAAKKLLVEVAREGSVLMSDLENDFYLTYDSQTGAYTFAIKLLRDWWIRYYDLVEVENGSI
jgi:hypothetical protein